MPIDLSPAGSPRPYPHRPRLWPRWFYFWLACFVPGSTAALLLWPTGVAAKGPTFWLVVAGLPNAVVVFCIAVERAGYEARWYRAHSFNQHRDLWLAGRIHDAQRPLHILGVGYCLPLNDQSLTETISATIPLLRPQTPRFGSGLIEHCRFEETSWMIAEPSFSAIVDAIDHPVALPVLMAVQALQPLADSLHALTQYERPYWPQVRVLCASGDEALHGQQLRHALQVAGLPALEVQPIASSAGLMIVDAWLDADETRPLLVFATRWHEHSPPRGSTEGCVAVLLAPRLFQLPSPVEAYGVLHRPIQGAAQEDLRDTLTHAAIWGRADLRSISRIWLSGGERDIHAARHQAGSDTQPEPIALYRPDRVIGDLAHANGWLSIVAAIESGARTGPQLIIDGMQAAILRVHPTCSTSDPASHDEPSHESAPA